MPIRQSERARYPANWKAISKQVREEAGQRCEICNAPNGEIVSRGTGPQAGTYMLDRGDVFCAQTGKHLGLARGSEYCSRSLTKIVLTVAHLDHQPENCARENLKALCQRCHLTYDAAHHARNAAETRRSRIAVGDLFAAKGGQ